MTCHHGLEHGRNFVVTGHSVLRRHLELMKLKKKQKYTALSVTVAPSVTVYAMIVLTSHEQLWTESGSEIWMTKHI